MRFNDDGTEDDIERFVGPPPVPVPVPAILPLL
jgi:hypothetical protein